MDANNDSLSLMVDADNVIENNSSTHHSISSRDELDIEAYTNLYSGPTKINRLLFIADHCGENLDMQLEALSIAYDEIKKGENPKILKEVANRIGGRLGPNYTLDVAWCKAADRRAEQKAKLDKEHNAHWTDVIEERMMLQYPDFGGFYYADALLGGFKSYIRNRMIDIMVAIENREFSRVIGYVNWIEQSQVSLDQITTAMLRCAAGLSNLMAKEYKFAAQKFIEVIPELGSHYNAVIACQDVATYGGLCALATFDRIELKNKVIDNTNFKKLLELEPDVRELINDFYSSRYASCLEYLGSLKAKLLLDMYLHDHVETLYDQIRQKALIQYIRPYSSVDLNMMANAFKTTVAELQRELATRIADNQIQARIDSVNKVLYVRHVDQRNSTFESVLETGREFDREVRSMLLRSNLIKDRCTRKRRQ